MNIDEIATRLSYNVRKIRGLFGWSQKKLADKAKVSEGTIKNIENVRRKNGEPTLPDVESLAQIAEAFGADISLLFSPDRQQVVSVAVQLGPYLRHKSQLVA